MLFCRSLNNFTERSLFFTQVYTFLLNNLIVLTYFYMFLLLVSSPSIKEKNKSILQIYIIIHLEVKRRHAIYSLHNIYFNMDILKHEYILTWIY